jgi:uncharacterized protein DUF6263
MLRAVKGGVVVCGIAVASGAAQAQDPVELKLKWSPGTRVVQRIQTIQDSEITIPSMPKPMNQTMNQTQEFAISVLKARPTGGYELEFEFLSMKMDMEQMGRKQTVDCATKPTDPIGRTTCGLVGGKVRFLLASNNTIEKVEGFDALMGKLTAGSPPEAASMLKGMFNEETIKQMSSSMFTQGLPEKPVKLGDTWPFRMEMPLPNMAVLLFEAKSTFKGMQPRESRQVALLEFSGTLSSKPLPGATMSVTLKDGASTGKTWFDPTLGMAVESAVEQSMTLDMKLPAAQGGQNISTKMKQRIGTKLVDVGKIPAPAAKAPVKR